MCCHLTVFCCSGAGLETQDDIGPRKPGAMDNLGAHGLVLWCSLSCFN